MLIKTGTIFFKLVSNHNIYSYFRKVCFGNTYICKKR